MKREVWREVLLAHLGQWNESMKAERLPEEIVTKALEKNPWFTDFFIRKNLTHVRSWLAEESVRTFFSQYPVPTGPAKRIGVIAAGNLPLVGFHDCWMTLLAGHQLYLKCSRQDRVLTEWIREQWISACPALEDQWRIVDHLPEVDALLATGSNNTARYFEQNYQGVPKLIRKNRYSVAYLDATVSEDQMRGLCEDVLLYNGLGCRNVSNLALTDDATLHKWAKILNSYNPKSLNPLYLERVLYVKAVKDFVGEKVQPNTYLLMEESKSFGNPSMGILQWVRVKGKDEFESLVAAHREDIQCVVGTEVAYGQAQYPSLEDFADQMDSMMFLSSL